MPDLMEFVQEGRTGRGLTSRRCSSGKAGKAAPVSDMKRLYLQSIRIVMRPRSLKDRAWSISGTSQRVGFRVLAKMGRETSGELRVVILKRFAHALSSELSRSHLRKAAGPDQRVHETFVSRALRLDKAGHIDAALDLLYDAVDEMMRSEKLDRLDSRLAHIPVANLSVDLLLGILTATLPAASRLASRSKLFDQVAETLRERGEYEEGLLTGLEG